MTIDALFINENLELYPTTEKSSFSTLFKEELALNCFSWASRLTDPICWVSSKVHRIRSSMDLVGRFDFEKTRTQEIFWRVIYGITTAIVLPFALIGGLLGLAVREAGVLLREKDHSYLQGKAPEKRLEGNSYSLLSWNVCGLSGGMSRSHGGVVEWEQRLNSILEKIEREDPDVLCLYEVQDTNLLYALRERLESRYAHFHLHMGTDAYKADSGIFIASKYKTSDFSFTRYNDKDGSSVWVNKGFASFEISSDGLKFSRIVATHNQHDEPPNIFEKTREKQMEQILTHLNGIDSKGELVSTVLSGDMNLERGSEEFRNSSLSKYFTTGYLGEEETRSNALLRELWNPKDKDSDLETIDYISSLKALPQKDLPFDPVQMDVHIVRAYGEGGLDASDHHGLLSVIRV